MNFFYHCVCCRKFAEVAQRCSVQYVRPRSWRKQRSLCPIFRGRMVVPRKLLQLQPQRPVPQQPVRSTGPRRHPLESLDWLQILPEKRWNETAAIADVWTHSTHLAGMFNSTLQYNKQVVWRQNNENNLYLYAEFPLLYDEGGPPHHLSKPTRPRLPPRSILGKFSKKLFLVGEIITTRSRLIISVVLWTCLNAVNLHFYLYPLYMSGNLS